MILQCPRHILLFRMAIYSWLFTNKAFYNFYSVFCYKFLPQPPVGRLLACKIFYNFYDHRIMEHFCKRRWSTKPVLLVSYSIHEGKHFWFQLWVDYYLSWFTTWPVRMVVHLLLLKFSMNERLQVHWFDGCGFGVVQTNFRGKFCKSLKCVTQQNFDRN